MRFGEIPIPQINAEFSKKERPSFEVYDLKGQLVHYFTLSTGVNQRV